MSLGLSELNYNDNYFQGILNLILILSMSQVYGLALPALVLFCPGPGGKGHLKNGYELFDLKALKFSKLYKNCIFQLVQSLGKIYTLLRSVRFKSSQDFELVSIF